MVVSFAQLWEQIEKDKMRRSPLMGSGEEERALTVVRVGKDMHEEGETPFWDEFISLCSNPDGLSELFGVSKEKIRSWPAKIREMLTKLDHHTAESPSEKPKTEVIPTGDNGAFTTNVDPNMGAMR